MFEILVSLGISPDIAFKASNYATTHNLNQVDQNKMTCCVVKKYAPDKYAQLAQDYPDVVQDCSPDDDCTAILSPAGL